jgi:hypothetical protein
MIPTNILVSTTSAHVQSARSTMRVRSPSGSASKIHVVNAIEGAGYTPGAPNPSWT